jgi:multicomponent Na+:H+ antiporter subunit D
VLLIASFGLLVLRGGRRQLDGAVRYVALNLVATVAFLTGVGLLYGATGTLNMADLRGAVAGVEQPAKVLVTAALLLFAFGAKAAMFPVFFWLPASYHTPSYTVSAVFAALLTKVGVYSAFRVFTLIYTLETPWLADAMLWGGAATMLAGVLGALAQSNLRRVLAFQVISSIGFMMSAAAIGTPAALAAAIFYLLQDMVLKTALFTAAWVSARQAGTEDIRLAGGLWAAAPLVSTLFLLPALSLAGLPPFAGFWAKVLVIDAALKAGYGWLAGLALAVGLLTLYSMGRVWAEMFWKARPAGTPVSAAATSAPPLPALAATMGLTGLVVWIGVAPEPFLAFAQAAGAQLADPAAYLAAVLGEG